jgi:methylmalonyl-CoA epimerase
MTSMNIETGNEFPPGMLKGIDHIGIAVRSLEQAVATYGSHLGLVCEGVEEIESQKVITASFRIGGVVIELLQPSGEEGPVARFLVKRGEGIHHIAYLVEDIEACLKELSMKGVPLIDHEARIGAGGSRIAFLHPRGMHGVLVELVERG